MGSFSFSLPPKPVYYAHEFIWRGPGGKQIFTPARKILSCEAIDQARSIAADYDPTCCMPFGGAVPLQRGRVVDRPSLVDPPFSGWRLGRASPCSHL